MEPGDGGEPVRVRLIGSSRAGVAFASAVSAARATTPSRVPPAASAWELLRRLRRRRAASFADAEVLVDLVSEAACTRFRGPGDVVAGGCYAALPRCHPLATAALSNAHRNLSARLRIDPSCWSAWAARGWCNLLLGRPHCAAIDGMECQDLAAFEPEGYGVVAEACLEMGGAAEARVHILNALSADAADDRLHFTLMAIEAAAKLVPASSEVQPEMQYSLADDGPAWSLLPSSRLERIGTGVAVGGSVQAVQTEDRGLVLTATKAFTTGDVLWIETPVVSVCLDPARCQRCMLPVRHAVQCDCGEVFCSQHCKDLAGADWHHVQCGEAAKRIAKLRETLWSNGLDVGQHYHVLMAARLSALALARAAGRSGKWEDVDIDPLDEHHDICHLVGLGDDADPETLKANTQPFEPLLKQYRLFCSLTGLGGASQFPAGRCFDFAWYSRLLGIFIANGMQDHIGGDAQAAAHVSLCAKGSLSNHSCNPNAGATSIATALVATGTHADGIAELERMPANTMVFRARRDIAGGDEINVAYITEAQLQQPAACRRNSLSHYLFWCRCERCELEDDAKAGTTSCTTATVLARN
jgi:hypothetical protein